MPGACGVTALAAGAFHTCSVLPGRYVHCTGSNVSAELGDGYSAEVTNLSRVVLK
ncbi:MAG: hypothetical protein H7222_07090 [Methylotenera sp.]|nr:hypothetical protein [Oligoflexia bacterium]